MLKLNKILLLIIVIFTTNSALSQPLWETLNNAVIKDHIIPRHQALENKASQLQKTAVEFCNAVNKKSHEQLQTDFFALNDAWMELQHIHHGPIHEDNRVYRIQLFPDKRDAVGKHLTIATQEGDKSRLTPDKFPRLTTALQGISTLEHLLFSDKYPVESFKSITAGQNFQCELVLAISQNLVNIAHETLSEWLVDRPPYNHFFNDKKYPLNGEGSERELQARIEVAAIIFNNYYKQMIHIIDNKLKLPLDKSIDTAKPFWTESQYSQRSLHNIKLNLETLENLYETSYAPYVKLRENGDSLHQQIKQAYMTTYKTIGSINTPLSQAVTDVTDRAKVEQLIANLDSLLQLTMEPMLDALKIPLTFNGRDGD